MGTDTKRAASRSTDIDALRVGATALLIWFHTNKVFDATPFYHIKNDVTWSALDPLSSAVHFWHMPLFFVLAGWSAFHSLSRRGAGAFARERRRRLLLPLAAGMLTFVPVIKWYELRSGLSMGPYGYNELATPLTMSLAEFWPRFYLEFGYWSWSHLWFLAYLATFSFLYRPLMLAWIADGSRWRAREGAWLWAPLALLALIQMTLRLVWPGGLNLVNDWANFAYYSTFFLCGFVLARHPLWHEQAVAARHRALGLALGADALLYAYWVASDGNPWPTEISLVAVARIVPILGVTAVAGYATVLALVGYARAAAPRDSPALAYLSEASMPVYVLHQLFVTMPGFYIVRSDLGFGAKYLAVLFVGYASTMFVYHFLVRPNCYLRPLVGLPANAPTAPAMAPRWRGATAGALLALTTATTVAAANPAPPADIRGLWYSAGGDAIIELAPCEDALCGRIQDLRHPLDEEGCPALDAGNPDPALRNRPLRGATIVGGLRKLDGATSWTDGWIYDPASGRSYDCSIELVDADRIEFRGYWGLELLGRTTTWWRVGSESRRCSVDSAPESPPQP